ncbi:hypothetical protein BVV20_01690 [Xanthomonas oryzae pv. oryzae]|nr:hypothetical protein BVV20_01690 [Xanthomonas oryzae pv. oryzae]
MICSSEKRFFTSNLLGIGNWTPNWGATQNRGDVVATTRAWRCISSWCFGRTCSDYQRSVARRPPSSLGL